MILNFYCEARFIKAKNGKIYSPKDVLKYSLFKRYLKSYSSVNVVARVLFDDNFVGDEKDLVEGEGVSVLPITYYVGPLDYLKKRANVFDDIKSTLEKGDDYILRVPGRMGSIAAKMLINRKQTYGVEVVGDPFEVFSKNGVQHPLRLFLKYSGYYQLKYIVKRAKAALYVTKYALQIRYPNKKSFVASNVQLYKEDFFCRTEESFFKDNVLNIISIGSLEQMYKGADVLIKAISILVIKGYDIKLKWVGEGKHLVELQRLVCDLGLSDRITFVGYIADRNDILRLLRESDLFVLASRTEGLPRVILEAFSQSLPVIGTAVGGIPELVEKSFLVKSEDYVGLSEKIKMFLEKPKSLYECGNKNFYSSKDFIAEKLQKERESFFNFLKS